MTNAERNTALYQKMFAEQEKFRDWLKSQSPEEILNHAYEYTIREDILLSLEYHDLSDAQTDALMKSLSPLADVFRDFEKWETDHMDVIWDCLESRADTILEEQRRTLRETPVYPYPASYAQEHGELEQYRASNRANIACKEAIEAAIREHYHDNQLDNQAATQVVDAFGLDRTLYVLANTVQQKDWDARFSPGNKEWAKTIPIQKNPDAWGADRNCQFVVNSHSGLTDLFLSTVRQEFCREKQAQKIKPSVLEKLQNQPNLTSPKISAKLKGKER